MQELEEKRLRKCITVVGQTVTEISVQRTFSRGTAGKGCCWKEALPKKDAVGKRHCRKERMIK